ncbi:unnamed protein product [Paramecium sonneborni]|uniref:RING-type E3 ubiquitin transferase n=1 Tax=Paramecium sonneborni TaxID=65129 RepID=A0A8S1LDH2_9CILI|nr:unnamed protein product [Paramecium sonneborni]
MDSKSDMKQMLNKFNTYKTSNPSYISNRNDNLKINQQQQQQQQLPIHQNQMQPQPQKIVSQTDYEKLKKENDLLRSELFITKEQLKNLTEDYQKLQQKYHQVQHQVKQPSDEFLIAKMQRQLRHQQYQEFMQEAMMPQKQFQTDGMTYEELLELQNQIGHVSRGLTKEQIKKIPKKIVYNKQKDVCSICQNDIVKFEKIRELKCKHFYHSKCIKKWLINEKKCPICQIEV